MQIQLNSTHSLHSSKKPAGYVHAKSVTLRKKLKTHTKNMIKIKLKKNNK